MAMVLSGGILAYFSINNISNLKELTEKRVLEEQRELGLRFTTSLKEDLERLTSGFLPELDQTGSVKDSLLAVTSRHDYIQQAFLMDIGGQFIVPYFKGINEQSTTHRHSDHFTRAFELGEKAEFAENDPGKARVQYLRCLDQSTTDEDMVMALNALGRVAVKTDQIDDADMYYGSVIRDYSHLSDRNSFPYAYYALSHLLTQAGPMHIEETSMAIASGLEQMESGIIPLNFQSEEILGMVSVWLEENSSIDTARLLEIERSVRALSQQVDFISQYREEITEIHKGTTKGQNSILNSFNIRARYTTTDPEFLLYNQDSAYTAGFLIDQSVFFDALLHAGLMDDMEFEYLFTFPTGYDPGRVEDKLTFTSQLSPYFPAQLLQIQIRDKDLIPGMIQRRSWIYGIASVLLLLTMLFGIILTLRDIAREKHVAKLRSDFISNVTHELKTPLTSIRMYAESLMMRRMKSYTGQRKYLSVIVNESERLKRMINNILEFSKMEKARQEYHRVESNLSVILQTAILDVDYWLEKHGFNMHTEIEPQLTAVVDPEKMYQVFSNLLSNAIKYSGDSRNIHVRLYLNNNSVITEVEDEGIGISKDNQARIFEEFFRVENQSSGNITGTGLGLTVVKEIVEAHQGSIEVESVIGKGSKFSVFLNHS
jgi:signal transduction histidine kinase